MLPSHRIAARFRRSRLVLDLFPPKFLPASFLPVPDLVQHLSLDQRGLCLCFLHNGYPIVRPPFVAGGSQHHEAGSNVSAHRDCCKRHPTFSANARVIGWCLFVAARCRAATARRRIEQAVSEICLRSILLASLSHQSHHHVDQTYRHKSRGQKQNGKECEYEQVLVQHSALLSFCDALNSELLGPRQSVKTLLVHLA